MFARFTLSFSIKDKKQKRYLKFFINRYLTIKTMKKKFNFNAFLDNKERSSNFGAGELQLEPLSGSDGTDNFSPAEGQGYVQDQSRVAAAQSAPTYQLRIRNVSTIVGATEKFVLFGFNKYFNYNPVTNPNAGSDPNIIVEPTDTDFTYSQFLAQSMIQSFMTMLIKALPEDGNFATIPPVFKFKKFDMGGDTLSSPVYTNAYLSDFQQFNQITMNVAKQIDGNTYIEGQLASGKSVIVSIFPAMKVNVSNSLGSNGTAPVKQYSSVPGVNVAPLPSAGRQVIAGTQMLPSGVPLA